MIFPFFGYVPLPSTRHSFRYTRGRHLLRGIRDRPKSRKKYTAPVRATSYLDEFTFRFNRRNSKSRDKLFYRLLQQAVQVDPVTYAQMIGEKNR